MNSWFSSKSLKLNPSKTEFIWLGSLRRLHPTLPSVLLGGCTIVPTSVVRDLGSVLALLAPASTTFVSFADLFLVTLLLFLFRPLCPLDLTTATAA